MRNRRLLLVGTGGALLLAAIIGRHGASGRASGGGDMGQGCGGAEEGPGTGKTGGAKGEATTAPKVGQTESALTVFSGSGSNAIAWNGLGWNGSSWYGVGWNGASWDGMGWNGSSWNGIGWNGSAWNGNGWGGSMPASDCTNGAAGVCTTLHNWVNHTDADGDGVAGTDADKAARVNALGIWVSCACAANVSIPFSDSHGSWSGTFSGSLGLAPTWCGQSSSAAVPTSEMEIVSACMLARTNLKGRHYPLSVRSDEASTALSVNEQLTQPLGLASYFGNLWKSPHADTDASGQQPDPNNPPGTQEGPWWNQERFVCSLAATSPPSDLLISGRDCEFSDCGGRVEYLGDCTKNQKRLGSAGNWDPSNPTASYSKAVAALASDPSVLGGIAAAQGNSPAGGGGTTDASMNYRGRTWRVIEVFGPQPIAMEDPFSAAPGSAGWTEIEDDVSGTLPSQSVDCSALQECEGINGSGRKLLGLNSSQAITVNFSGNNFPTPIAGDPNGPLSVAIRYSRPTLLGAGQCDPDLGCMNTAWSECASGSVGASGCIGGASNPGLARIWVESNTPKLTSWALVHGTGSPYGKNVFPPTSSPTKYSVAYIYPIYPQSYDGSIQNMPKRTSGTVYDTVRVWLAGETANASDAPQFDYAYFFPGPPPQDADCSGPHGCWLYAGPNQNVQVPQGQSWNWTSPTLTSGTYTFRLVNMNGDQDLYVKANAAVSMSSWDCRPYLGYDQDETCTVSLNAPGYFSVMVNGYENASGSSQAYATFIANN